MARKFITSLTARPALRDAEVNDALAIELARERKEADEAMAAVIADAETRTFYLSPAIFYPVRKLRARHNRTARIVADTKETGLTLAVMQSGLRQCRVELETAVALRAIRLSVSHTDPADYWSQRLYERSHAPIFLTGGAKA